MPTTERFTGSGLLDQLCRQNGWGIDEREGPAIALHFDGDDSTDRRTIVVIHEDGDEVMTFNCSLCSSFPRNRLPGHIPMTLLARNRSKMVGWNAVERDGRILFKCGYVAPTHAVDADFFKLTCKMLLREVANVEGHLRQEGLI